MRILSLAFSLVVTVALVGAVLAYLEHRIGQHRIQVQEEWLSSSDQLAYRSYGDTDPAPDSVPVSPEDSLPPER